MPKIVQRRGLTTAQLAATAGAARELIVDTNKNTVVVMDGVTNGGFPLVKTNEHESAIIDVDATVAANNLTLTINPATILFRSTTLTDGTPVAVVTTTAKTVVVPNTATLGTINATAARLAILAINSAGVIETAVVNMAGGLTLDETGLISTTAVSAASDSNNVIYSTTARTNVAYRVVGFVDITQATAGTWATAPSKVQGFGGLALIKQSGITSGVPVTATGTSIDFTGIPATAKRITVMFDGVSTNGTSPPQIQIGDAGGIENTGYLNSNSAIGAGVASVNFTTGFGIGVNTSNWLAATVASGAFTIINISANVWVIMGSLGASNAAQMYMTAGSKSLSATLDRLRITTVNGTDTFDAGSINILYE